MRILLIDDDRDDYLITRDLLAEVPSCPFELEWVGDYDAGLGALKSGRHDVCLLDYRLGAKNGLDLLREVRESGELHATVIMLTGQTEDDLDNAALLGGVAAFLKKEALDARQLDRAIRYALTQSKHAEELERQVADRTRELAAANASLTLADRRKDEFIAVLAHELRNPLAPIVNALHVLKLDAHPRKKRAAIEMMQRQVGQMVRLVDDLLDVGRINTGKIELSRGRVELASVVNHAVEAALSSFEALRQRLAVDLPGGPIYVDGDRARLAQVVGNLLNNASKFTLQGGRIDLKLEHETGQAVIRVRDDGIGLAADQLSRIFELFAQVDSGTGRARGGLGIGLALVKTIVEMHGGTIDVTSPGLRRGSEFVVRLPALPPERTQTETLGPPPSEGDEPSGEAASTRAARYAAASSSAQERKVEPRCVLVVDDNRDAAESLALMLELDGHTVRMAHDGASAVEIAATWQPDVVLLDIGLPGMNGYEAARRMRALPRKRPMRIVATTGWGQEEDRAKSAQAGFDAHLVKPVEPAQLATLLVKLMA